MPRSLSSRIYGLAILFAVAVLLLAGSLFVSMDRTRTDFDWVQHTQEVLRTAEELRAEISNAESGQRGFLLTRSPAFLASFDNEVKEAQRLAAMLSALTSDNPSQHQRAMRLQDLTLNRVGVMKGSIATARAGDFEAAAAIVSSSRGKARMEELLASVDDLADAEHRLLNARVHSVERSSVRNHLLLSLGLPALGLLVTALVSILVASVKRPLRGILEAITAFGQGDRTARAPERTGSIEFHRLAASYNAMAEQLEGAMQRQEAIDQQLQAANAELRKHAHTLAERARSTELLASMAHRMQACRTDPELTAVLENFLPRVLPDEAGALYVHNNSRNMLVRLVQWGAPAAAPECLAPQDCWGLRRGQSHAVAHPGADITCAHVGSASDVAYHCEPVLAGGEVVGLLYLEGQVSEEGRPRLTILCENIALSLVNHRLQRSLREQSIRDPLTNLFNRRYMEEALTLEAARSQRSGTNLGIIMCDIDHFKRFNDRLGHEAGDVLLSAVASLIRAHFRDGDIACRYGGEEFAIIAPGADVEHLHGRSERLRQAITELSLQHQGRALEEISMSFGIASSPVEDDSGGLGLVRAADGALYQAKRAGRNRVVVADAAPRLDAAAE